MIRDFAEWFDRRSPGMPAWMLMLAGMALLSMAILIPAWLEARELNWQHEVMKLQLERLQQQETQYQQFLEALEAEDPTVLERLALAHLHLKPAGADPIGCVDHHCAEPRVVMVDSLDDPEQCRRLISEVLNDPGAGSVDRWLAMPPASEGADYQPLPALGSYAVRIASGPTRIGLAASAVLCLAASMIISPAGSR